MKKSFTSISALMVFISGISLCQAVKTQYWQDTESKDFKAGKTENLVISNLGQLRLGPQQTELLSKRTDVSLVFEVRRLPDGSLIVATGSEGKVLIYKNKKWDVLYKADQPYIFSLEVGKTGKVYIGTGGAKGKVYQIDPASKKAKLIFEDKSTHYVWKLKLTNDGGLLAATGPEGKLFRIDKSGQKCIFDCKQKNLLSLTVGHKGTIYVGTDKGGIIYKITKDTKGKYSSRALYDANEDEISAIAIDADGMLYAATASGKQSKGQARAYLKKPAGQPVTSKPVNTKSKNRPSKIDQPPKGLPFKIPPELAGMQMGKMPPTGKPAKGNAVYQIDSLGFVNEVFRDKVNILSMIAKDGKLYLGTAPDGIIYEITPASEEVAVYAKIKSDSIMTMTLDKEGSIIAGTANAARILKLGPQLAKKGSYTSKVFDGKQICRWGTIKTTYTRPADKGCSVEIQTRSSVISNPDEPGWSDWKTLVDAGRIASPPARFLQYRAIFKSNGKLTPALDAVQIAYMQDNLAPELTAVSVSTGHNPKPAKLQQVQMRQLGKSMPQQMYKITWKAKDPNGDKLVFDVYLRRVGTKYWIELKKDYTQQLLQWNPKTVPDGKYQVRVLASDALANPADMGKTAQRISDKFIVDNTPPRIKNFACTLSKSDKQKKLFITADIVDAMTEISGAWITINSSKDWQYVAPADELYDSKAEHIETLIPLDEKTSEPVMVSMKVKDRYGNINYAWQIVVSSVPATTKSSK